MVDINFVVKILTEIIKLCIFIFAFLLYFSEGIYFESAVQQYAMRTTTWLILKGMVTHLGLFYAWKLGNHVHCTCIFVFLFFFSLRVFFFCIWFYGILLIFGSIYLTHGWDLNWYNDSVHGLTWE